jgi:hypothetical protein
VRTEVELRANASTVEILSGNQRVAVHPYAAQRGAHTTTAGVAPCTPGVDAAAAYRLGSIGHDALRCGGVRCRSLDVGTCSRL